MLFEGIAIAASQAHRIAHRDAAVFTGELHDLERQLRQCGQHKFFTLD